MTRIIGGSAGGRRLRTPTGDATRPTSDRVREALFSALESRLGSLAGLHVLDVYAGSGAVGLEAASRGAVSVTLVEHNRRTAALIRENASTLGLPAVDVVAGAALAVTSHPPRSLGGAAYDVVFLDPPYDLPAADLEEVLAALVDQAWLAEDGLIVVERRSRRGEFSWPHGIDALTSKKYGETTLWYGRAN